MIDTSKEPTFPLTRGPAKLAHLLERRIHTSTFYRWSTVGCRGVVLETIQIGGTRCTSREALQRFFERLSQPGPRPANQTPAPGLRSAIRRLRDSERAAAELEAKGA